LPALIIAESDRASVGDAVAVLRSGGLVCYPTDTVYGMGAAAGDDAAVRHLYAVKGRPPGKPLPLLLADAGDAARIADVTPLVRSLAGRFWPGPLTIIVRKLSSYRSLALAGGETIALRVPDHSLVRSIARTLGEPLTGTSANRAGAPAAVSAAEAEFQLGEMVDLIIDGGPCRNREESTIIDITQEPPRILRAGAVSREELEAVAGQPVGAP
jgi:L-threonylcarbamoyladenylate synthase